MGLSNSGTDFLAHGSFFAHMEFGLAALLNSLMSKPVGFWVGIVDRLCLA